MTTNPIEAPRVRRSPSDPVSGDTVDPIATVHGMLAGLEGMDPAAAVESITEITSLLSSELDRVGDGA